MNSHHNQLHSTPVGSHQPTSTRSAIPASTGPNNAADPRTRLGAIIVAFALVTSVLASVVGFTAAPANAIVKGTKAQLGDHPYQVALEDQSGQFCGGSLIATDVVLTAAHCLDEINPRSVSIRAGVVDLDDQGQFIRVTRSVVHEKWGGVDGDTSYDIALLFLQKSFALNANVGLIDAESTAVDTAATPGTTVTVSGWGALSERSEKIIDELRHTDVKLINDRTCANRLGDDSLDNFSMICTAGTGNGACYGDSGGPLAKRNNDGSWTQVGIVSWGTVCGSRQVAGIYSDLANLRPWITAARGGQAPAPKPAPTPAPKPSPKPGGGNGVKVDVISENGRLNIAGRDEISSFMDVTAKGTTLVDVDVIIRGFSHQRVADLDVILVSPEGTEVVLLSDAGGNRAMPTTGIRFDNSAKKSIPESGTIRGRYQPTSNIPELGNTDLSAFHGENPNGEWELYIADSVRGKRGRVAGWTLVTKTR